MYFCYPLNTLLYVWLQPLVDPIAPCGLEAVWEQLGSTCSCIKKLIDFVYIYVYQ